MAWTPISGTVPQYQKSDGTLASDYYIKFYQDGTTTAFSMATDSTGGTTLDKAKINSSGYPVNGSDAVFIPHVNQTYKIVLYKNATDADNDTTANADWVVDNIEQVQAGTGTIDASNVTYTPAGTGAVATNVQTKLRESVSVKDFGAVGDGVTDDSSAFETAFSSLSQYTTLYIPAGNYIINSDNMTTNFLEVTVDDVVISGDGPGITKLTMTGTGNKGFIYSDNQSRIIVRDIEFVGNNESTSFSYEGTAVWFNYSDTGAAAGHGDCSVINCKGSEFKGPYWFLVHNQRTTTTYPADNFRFENISCSGGSDRNQASLGTAARQIGGHCVNGGQTRNVVVDGCICEASDVKQGIAFQADSNTGFCDVKVSNCIVLNAGANNVNTDVSRYGIMFYFFIEGAAAVNCTMRGCGDLGMYAVSNISINVTNCTFEDCDGSDDGTLVKGGLGISGCKSFQVTGCTFRNNGTYHAQFTPSNDDFQSGSVTGNSFNVEDGTSSGIVKIRTGNASATAPTGGINFSSNNLSNSRILLFEASGGQITYGLKISDNVFWANANMGAVQFIAPGSQNLFRDVSILDNEFILFGSGAIDYGIRGTGGPSFGTGLRVCGNKFNGDPGETWVDVRVTQGVKISDNHFSGVSTGYCFGLELVQGVLHDNTFNGISTSQIHENISATPGNDLGRSSPTWTGYFGARVQVLNSSRVSQSAEWLWDTTSSSWIESINSTGTTGGSGSAGSGNQYVELTINGTTYKVLHDGTV